MSTVGAGTDLVSDRISGPQIFCVRTTRYGGTPRALISREFRCDLHIHGDGTIGTVFSCGEGGTGDGGGNQ